MSRTRELEGIMMDMIEALRLQTRTLETLMIDLGRLHTQLPEKKEFALVASQFTELHLRMKDLMEKK